MEISGRIEEYVSGSGEVIGYELNIKKMEDRWSVGGDDLNKEKSEKIWLR